MFNIEGDKFREGDELIWIHKNGMTEKVRFLKYSEATVVVMLSSYPHQPTVGQRFHNGKKITVPLSDVSRAE